MPSGKNSLSHSNSGGKESVSQAISSDPEELKTVQSVLSLMEKTFNQAKIFSFEHDNVHAFLSRTFHEITSFLKDYPRLELDIQETTFTYKDEIVHSEPDIKKSIPYLLFKDGMQSLIFSVGLQEKELEDFFQVLHECSLLPSEESDSVYSIWEKNFTHIHHSATDQLLLTRVKSTVRPYDPVDMFTGSVDWEEEGTELEKGDGENASSADFGPPAKKAENSLQEDSEQLAKNSTLSEKEEDALQYMVLSNRKINTDDELTALLLEILYLAEEEGVFSDTVKSISEHLRSIIKKCDFAGSAYLVGSIREMEHEFIHLNPSRLPPLQGYIKTLSEPQFLDEIRKTVTVDPAAAQNDEFLLFLNFLGPTSFSLIRDLYLARKDDGFYLKVYDFFLRSLQTDPASFLSHLTFEDDGISRAAITALGDSGLPETVDTLAQLLSRENYIFTEDIIHALGKIDHVNAARAILSLLTDPRPDIRSVAFKNIVFHPDLAFQKDLDSHIRGPGFLTYSLEDKGSLLFLLGKFNNPQASTLIGKFIEKPGWVGRKKKLALALISISVLEKMTNSEAKDKLKQKQKLKNLKIRRACRNALAAETDQKD